jgi:hypothetical protein
MAMKKVTSKRLAFLGCALVTGASALAAGLVACGGDDTTAPAPSEAGPDGTMEAASNDATQDTTTPADGGVEGGGEAAADAAPDVALDAPPDVVLGLDASGAALLAYPHAVDVAYCQREQQCCQVTPAQYDVMGCANLLDMYGGALRTGIYSAAFDGGHVGLNPATVASCFNEIAAIPCGMIAASVYAMAVTNCNAAIVGLIPLDAGGCTSSVECATGGYCTVPTGPDAGDSGIGTCVPLQGSGAGCTNPPSQLSPSEQCTYLGNGQPPLYCNFVGDSGMGQCTGAHASDADAGCTENAQCLSGFCGGTCLSQTVFSDLGIAGGICDSFTIKDGGAD